MAGGITASVSKKLDVAVWRSSPGRYATVAKNFYSGT